MCVAHAHHLVDHMLSQGRSLKQALIIVCTVARLPICTPCSRHVRPLCLLVLVTHSSCPAWLLVRVGSTASTHEEACVPVGVVWRRTAVHGCRRSAQLHQLVCDLCWLCVRKNRFRPTFPLVFSRLASRCLCRRRQHYGGYRESRILQSHAIAGLLHVLRLYSRSHGQLAESMGVTPGMCQDFTSYLYPKSKLYQHRQGQIVYFTSLSGVLFVADDWTHSYRGAPTGANHYLGTVFFRHCRAVSGGDLWLYVHVPLL
jgi:hypothetical protein